MYQSMNRDGSDQDNNPTHSGKHILDNRAFDVVVACVDEAHQYATFDILTADGMDCRMVVNG